MALSFFVKVVFLTIRKSCRQFYKLRNLLVDVLMGSEKGQIQGATFVSCVSRLINNFGVNNGKSNAC